MIYRNKIDQEAWLREKTLDSLKANTFLQENDIVQVAEDRNFYKVVKTTTSIPLQNELFAQAIPSELAGNIATATKLKTPRNIALTGDVTGNTNFDGSTNVTITATVGNDSHTHSNGTITSLDASKVNTGVLNVARIPNLDANKITSGTISIERLPQGALERCVVVTDDTARFKLTTTQVQQGDTVKVTATNKMYFVIDTAKLSTEAGYTVYTAGIATEVPWSGVTGKPSTMPNPQALTISLNGTSQGTYNGSAAKSINITPASIGAQVAGSYALSNHNHSATQITEDTSHRFVTDSEKTKWNNKSDANHNHDGVYQPVGNYAHFIHKHNPSDINLDTNNRFVSDKEKTEWSSKADADHKHNFDELNLELVNNDIELDLISGEDYYQNKEEYTTLAEENECFSVKSMNDINNSIKNNTPISNEISNDILETLLRIPDDNNNFVYQNQNYIFGNKIKKLRNMSNIRDVFTGNNCSYVLTYENELFSFGYGEHGQLGDGDNIAEGIHKVQIPKKPIKQISIEHGRNCMVLYEDEEIWVFGKNNDGCLGIGNNTVIKTPIKLNLSFSSKIKQICTKGVDGNYNISAILLENGELYVCGSGYYYATGLEHSSDTYSFVKNNFKFDSKPIKIRINSVYNHINLFVITENGSIYSTGYRNSGATMTGENTANGIPGFTKATLIPKGEKVINMFCSVNDYIIITDKSTYFYGYNACSSLGLGHANPVYTEFVKSDFFSNKKIIDFNANMEWDSYGNHYLSPMILTDDGCVYCSGRSNGLLNGIDNSSNIEYFRKMNINGKRIISCKTGHANRFFLTDEGEIYVTGENDNKESFLIPANSGYIHLLNYDFNNKDMYVNKSYIKKECLDESRCIEIYREEI